MQIKQLEISGFKSFVDRTVMRFDHDVTGIVGPNGCGKSNIVDAIRWCMGEQSARHLRGKAMTDVIFNGSDTRGPHGVAEVSLTFDNTDAERAFGLPLEYRDYAEITVTRRLFRDGTSEYLINKTQVRLKDITDLFLGTGVGTKAYSIIEQGKIGLIVSARAEERRLLIEEAAGITKYKSRRKQAEQKMDLTRQNLSRVGDILAEVERAAASLKRQADKAERYKAYRAELEDLMLHEASHAFLERHVMLQVETRSLTEANEGASTAKGELETREVEAEALRQRVYQLENVAEKAQSEAYALTNEVRSLDGDIARGRDRLASLATREKQISIELADLHGQGEALVHERDTLASGLRDEESEEREQSDMVLDAQERLSEALEEERQADRALADLRARAAEATTRVATAEARMATFARRFSDLQTRRERLTLEADTVRSERDSHEERRQSLAEQLGELNITRDEAEARRTQYDTELKAGRETLVVEEKEVQREKNELSQRRNRLRALEEVTGRLEGVGVGVKALLATKDPCLVGMVADHIQAPTEITSALAAALGDRLQGVVVEDLDRGAELLAGLASAKKGRAMIVPRPPRIVSDAYDTPSDESVVGKLVDLVTCEPDDRALARGLLSGWLVVREAVDALRLSRDGYSGSIVALDGTVVFPDGRVVGGAGDAVGAGILGLNDEKSVSSKAGSPVARVRSSRRSCVRATQGACRRACDASRQGSSGFASSRNRSPVSRERSSSRRGAKLRRRTSARSDRARGGGRRRCSCRGR
ncbi:MAG: chromosome segregation protein SMC [Polyangiaceae bacterium]